MLNALRRRLPFLPPPPPVVPLVRLEGVIGRSGGRLSRNLSLQAIEDTLDRAFKMAGSPAVALVVNSPGGSPAQSRLIHERVRSLALKHEKRVFAFCEDLAASGGYIIALSADEIWADSSSIVGSIGVISATFGVSEAIGRLGIERRVYTAGRLKQRLDPFRPESEDDVAWIKALLGHVREVLRERYGDRVRFRAMPPVRPPLLARLMGAGAGAVVEAAEERLAWARYGL
jgi:ClpP class serine protease